MAISSIVLAGGLGSRLGRDKFAEVISGRSLIEWVIDRVRPVSSEILIVISDRQSTSAVVHPEARTVVDIYPGKGSLGGIYTGLMYATSFHMLAVACDMPFLNGDLLRYMIDLSSGYDVVLPKIGRHREPLHAVYSKNCLEPMAGLIEQGELRIARLLDSVRVRYLDEGELDVFDPEHLSFFNVNTPEDLAKARLLAQQMSVERKN